MKMGNLIIKAYYPGSGKTYMAINYCKRHTLTFIVACPSNAQAENIKKEFDIDACTIYKLCGATVGYESKNNKTTIEYECVVIDEIYMLNSVELAMLWRYMKKHPNTLFIATGDVLQIKPVEDSFNTENIGWHDRAINSMFIEELFLKTPKRLEYKYRDLPKLYKLKWDLFDARIDKIKVLKSFATVVSNDSWMDLYEPGDLCVAYFNETRHFVNNKIHKHLGFSEYYIKGHTYICKKNRGELHVNTS